MRILQTTGLQCVATAEAIISTQRKQRHTDKHAHTHTYMYIYVEGERERERVGNVQAILSEPALVDLH